ncbi:MAG: transporter substrate-binding domain-containing protein [Lachnospiraceae bacterium]
MKKLLSLALIGMMTFSMVACGSTSATTESEEVVATEEVVEEEVVEEEVVEEAVEEEVVLDASVLEGALIGVQLGTTGDIYCTDEFGDENIERYNKGYEAVQALLQGKIDAVVIDDQPAAAFVEANEGLILLDTPYTEEQYALCIEKENTDLVTAIDAAIDELKTNGTFDAIVDYYINDNTEIGRYVSPEGIEYTGEIIMATNAEFPPYEYKDGDEIIGLDADFARAIADILGYELVIEDMAFDSIIAAVSSGKADFGAAGMTVTEERLAQINFSQSYYTGKQAIIIAE